MIITKTHVSRRFMLRGFGAALALPILDSMVPALTAVARTGAAPVKRLGVFYVPNGMSMPYWFPKTEGPLAELPPTLRSLAPFKDRVLLCGDGRQLQIGTAERVVHAVQIEVNWSIVIQCGDFFAHVGRVFPCLKLTSRTVFNKRQVIIDAVKSFVLLQQRDGRLFANTRHARNIIGSIAF